MGSTNLAFVHACSLEELKAKGPIVARGADRPVVLFLEGEQVHALDNRCPHLGFPLHRGTLDDGMVTCHWHHARFDACSGCTFDLWADDVPAFDVEVRDGQVYITTRPRSGGTPDRDAKRLEDGMRHNIGLIIAKAILALQASGVETTAIVRRAALYGAEQRDGWGAGMTVLTAMANLLPHLKEETAYLALYHGVRQVAGDCAGQTPRHLRRPLESSRHRPETLARWLHYWALVRHRDGAERTVLTAMARGDTRDDVAGMLLAAAGDRHYADTGHLLDFTNKACELLKLIGAEHATAILPTVVGQLVGARGGEEQNAWRHPIDLVPLVAERIQPLQAHLQRPSNPAWSDNAALADCLLGEDPHAALDAMVDAAKQGAALAELTRTATYAAALRIARFGTVNEMSDWNAALHSFTFCNALDAAACRQPDPELAASLMHGAMSIYLNRFLNVPPAKLPNLKHLDTLPAKAETLLTAFLAALDTRDNVDVAASLVARYLALEHAPRDLIDTLTFAVVREDAAFHTFQALEAAVRQFFRWSPRPEAALVLLAAARYIAAHSPTPRARHQIARTAWRLHRGETIHDNDGD